jgi:hypothetical protein
MAPKILEPKKSPILIFCRQFSNIEAKLWFHFLSSRFLSHFCIHHNKLRNVTHMDYVTKNEHKMNYRTRRTMSNIGKE